MPIKHSTSALTKEQHAAQDARYAEGHEYDYIFVGTGNTSLTAAALLAKSGAKVCMLEAHDIPGGYAQTFVMGDYKFCAQIHYTWGCAPGGKIHALLAELGLTDKVTWELYDPEGYDHMVMPDGKRIKVPYGWDKLVDNIAEAYPHERKAAEKFVDVMKKIREETARFPAKGAKWYEYITKSWQFPTLIKYRNKTLQDVFDECGLGKEGQLILCANAGDFMSPPRELSVIIYCSLFGGYNTGAYYPTKDYKQYIDSLVEVITGGEGSHIYYETPVTKIDIENGEAKAVHTANGKTFTAPKIICGMDPQAAAKELIGWDNVPASYQKKLSYDYCPSGMTMYLGIKPGYDLKKHGLGKFNVWHCEDWDMNEMWDKQAAGNFDKPWWFMSTPTLHTDFSGNVPEGGQVLEIASYCTFESFKEAQDRSYAEYAKMKMALMNRLIDLVEEKYLPGLKENIAVKVAGTPVTNQDFVKAPFGTAYGAAMRPDQVGLNRLKAKTPWTNMWWSNQSAGYPGLYGTASTGISLYHELTGDNIFERHPLKGDDEVIAAL